MRIDPSNAGQLRGWDGDTGDFWTENAQRFDDGVAAYQARFLAAADIGADSTVLDVGCGAGRTTRDAARLATAGSALGVDLSASLVALAGRLAEREQVPNASFRQADAQTEPFPAGAFDVAVSRHGSMFFGDPVAAFTNITRALRPGGRLVLLTWQPFERQEWLRTFLGVLGGGPPPSDGPSPVSLGDPDRIEGVLTAAGLVDVRCHGLEEPMYFGADADDALRFVAGQQAGLIDRLDAAARARALDALRAALAEHLTGRGVLFGSAAWLVTATHQM